MRISMKKIWRNLYRPPKNKTKFAFFSSKETNTNRLETIRKHAHIKKDSHVGKEHVVTTTSQQIMTIN